MKIHETVKAQYPESQQDFKFNRRESDMNVFCQTWLTRHGSFGQNKFMFVDARVCTPSQLKIVKVIVQQSETIQNQKTMQN